MSFISKKAYHVTSDHIEELEGQRRLHERPLLFWGIALLALGWSIFQLYVAFFPTNSTMTRSIHLGLALMLAFLLYPIHFHDSHKSKIPFYDVILAVAGSLGALYIFLDFYGLSQRPGAYLERDIIIALLTMVILLEASRRVLGLALGIVASCFLIYDFFGPYMPDLIAHKGASIEKLAGHMFLTTEGIFGVPLGVSASFIYLFVLFGSLLEKAGAGEYFINLSYALLGRYRGGPAKASVVASGLTGVVSGSSVANVVTTGTFTIPLMKNSGMTGEKAAAIEVAASVNGQLMPPIMGAAAFIIAEFLGMNYTHIMFAAAIPAFATYFGLFYIIHLESCKLGLKGLSKEELPPKLATFLSGVHYLVPVFFLLYTLLVLNESVMSAAFNAIMLLLLIMATQRPIQKLMRQEPLERRDFLIGFEEIFWGMVTGAKNMIPIALATATAGIIVGSVTLTGIGQVLAEIVETLSGGNIFIVLVLTALMSLILGMGLPTTANYIVVASLTAPVILMLAHDNGFLIPAIAAHLFVFYFGILADDTPPVGIAAYAAAGIAKSDPVRTGVQGFLYDMRVAILPFIFFFNTDLLLIESVNPANPSDPNGWVWITNPFEIGLIFTMACAGIFAFASVVQGYFLTRLNLLERALLLPVIPLTLLPEQMGEFLTLPFGEGGSFALGAILYFGVYLSQKYKLKHQVAGV